MKNNAYFKYYLSLFQGLRNKINYLVYDQTTIKGLSDITGNDLKKFSFMVMVCDSDEDKYRWLLLEDQRNYVIGKLEENAKLSQLNIEPEKFYNIWINFHLYNSGLVRYFTQTNKDTEYIINFKKETYLISKGYEQDYNNQETFNELRCEYRKKINNFDPFVELESIWGFSGVSFFYIKLPKVENLRFIGIFPIICKTEKYFLERADFIFSLVKNAVLGANLMKNIMDENIKSLDNALIKTAIISILVDSYAHNISAHSLAALKWWFHIRTNDLFDKKINLVQSKRGMERFRNTIKIEELKATAKKTEDVYKNIGLSDSSNSKNYTSLMELIQFLHAKDVENIFSYQAINDKKKIFHIPVSIDYAIYHFLRFLRDKAGFWSGVTRDMNFGGESKNLYDVLWNDFASNSLYLGTISHSEGINKVNIYIKTPELENFAEFAKIDLSLIKREEKIAKGINPKIRKGLPNKYRFTIDGKNHLEIKKVLDKEIYNSYFPGGVVGEHAFFTLIENMLRNIKHYKKSEDWKKIKKDGINLAISIKPVSLMGGKKDRRDKELFEVEIFLKHKTNLNEGNKVVEELRKRSSESILNESGSPKLGGTFQDKICAAMLLNGTFSSVDKSYCDDEFIRERNDFYYNSDTNGNFSKEESRSWIGFREKKNSDGSKYDGILKKYFYLWKSKLIFKIERMEDLKNENINRFKFLQTSDQKIVEMARRRGVVRILDKIYETDIEVYTNWLMKWINQNPIKLSIKKGSTVLSSFYIENNEICFIKKDEYNNNPPRQFLGKKYPEIIVEHGHNNNALSIRNHGVLLGKIYKCSDDRIGDADFKISVNGKRKIPNNYQIHNENINRVFDLIETIFTKITIFDDRLYERFESKKKGKKETIKKQLNIEFLDEDQSKWEKTKKSFNSRSINFLILHLSFIEKIKMANTEKKYKEEEISKFIRSELNLEENEVLNNFILVITTGRGRVAFWENLDEYQKQFVTFKPIESLLSALEDALIMNDDFQIKHNICKVLFGS
jgi:hypothetical protein